MGWRLSGAACAVWAKSDRYRTHGGPVQEWLPLWRHLDDSAGVAGLLWDRWLAPSVQSLIAAPLPGGEQDGRRLLTFLAGVHDIGKATPAFACQEPTLADLMRQSGFALDREPPGRERLRHELAGMVELAEWLEREHRWTARASRALAAPVGGHHGVHPDRNQVMFAHRDTVLRGTGLWEQVRCELLQRAAGRSGVLERLDEWRDVRLPQPVQVVLTGLVVMADWIASNDELFPLVPLEHQPDPGPGSDDEGRIVRAWKQLDLPPRWRPVLPAGPARQMFRDRFPGISEIPRPVQVAAVDAAHQMPPDGLMIIEAAMGEGKTEAGLLAAEVLAARRGASGCLICLPTMATTNAMFRRLLGWLENMSPTSAGEARTSAFLAHGRAWLNDDYVDLFRGRSSFAGIGDEQVRNHADRGAQDPGPFGAPGTGTRLPMDVVAHRWLTGRRKGVLASFVAATIDQYLFAALKARFLPLRHLALASKVVILDEVHAADPYMSTYLERALEWLGACGSPTILMSATLPVARRAALLTAYERGRSARLGIDPDRPRDLIGSTVDVGTDYPLIITSATGAVPAVHRITGSTRTNAVRVARLDDTQEALADLLVDRLAAGGAAVVIRNTVRRARASPPRWRAPRASGGDPVTAREGLCCPLCSPRERG